MASGHTEQRVRKLADRGLTVAQIARKLGRSSPEGEARVREILGIEPPPPWTIVVTIDADQPDREGKWPFTIEWQRDGNPKAQCFRSDPVEHVRRLRANGWEVRIVDEKGLKF